MEGGRARQFIQPGLTVHWCGKATDGRQFMSRGAYGLAQGRSRGACYSLICMPGISLERSTGANPMPLPLYPSS